MIVYDVIERKKMRNVGVFKTKDNSFIVTLFMCEDKLLFLSTILINKGIGSSNL